MVGFFLNTIAFSQCKHYNKTFFLTVACYLLWSFIWYLFRYLILLLDELCALCELEQSCSGNQQKAVMLTCLLANLCRGIAQSVIQEGKEGVSAVILKSIRNWACLALVLSNLCMKVLLNLLGMRVCICISLQLDESKYRYFLNIW